MRMEVVYFVKAGDVVKVGYTGNPAGRLSALRSVNPAAELLALVPGDRALESAIHERLRHLRVHGEWFLAGNELDAQIATLREARGSVPLPGPRGYSREFTPKTERRLTLMADRVPAKLHEAVIAKVKRQRTSVREVILKLVSEWVKASE